MDPLDQARLELSKLRDSDDWNEDTTPNLHVHNHFDQHKSESKPPKGAWAVARWVLLAIATAIGTGLAAYLQSKGH